MPFLKLCLSIVIVSAVITAAIVTYKMVDLPSLAATAQEWREDYPMTVMLSTIGFVTVWSLVLPTTPCELVMGYLFGVAEGWAINYFVKFLSSSISYVLGRTVLRNWLHSLWLSSGKHELLSAFEDEVAERPYATAFLMRVAYVPISIKNYGMALIGVPPAAFYAAFFSVEFFDSYLLIAVGAGAKDLHELLSGRAAEDQQRQAWLQLGLLGLEVVVLVVLLIHLGNLASKAVERRRTLQRAALADSASTGDCGDRGMNGSGPHATQSGAKLLV